jgi:hypothetical protein
MNDQAYRVFCSWRSRRWLALFALALLVAVALVKGG